MSRFRYLAWRVSARTCVFGITVSAKLIVRSHIARMFMQESCPFAPLLILMSRTLNGRNKIKKLKTFKKNVPSANKARAAGS